MPLHGYINKNNFKCILREFLFIFPWSLFKNYFNISYFLRGLEFSFFSSIILAFFPCPHTPHRLLEEYTPDSASVGSVNKNHSGLI